MTSMVCYVVLTKLPNYAKIKQTPDIATAILRGGVDFGYGRKKLTLGKTSTSNLAFRSGKSRRNQYIENVEFFDDENKKAKNIHIYSAYQELKHSGLKI